jgi:hypothetical protein
MTPSKIIDPNNNAPAQYQEKLTFEKKTFYDVSCQEKYQKVLETIV